MINFQNGMVWENYVVGDSVRVDRLGYWVGDAGVGAIFKQFEDSQRDLFSLDSLNSDEVEELYSVSIKYLNSFLDDFGVDIVYEKLESLGASFCSCIVEKFGCLLL